MKADEKERGAVVCVDVVVELAADARALDFGGKQYECRMLGPILVFGSRRREI